MLCHTLPRSAMLCHALQNIAKRPQCEIYIRGNFVSGPKEMREKRGECGKGCPLIYTPPVCGSDGRLGYITLH
jgi:hypothetical protein